MGRTLGFLACDVYDMRSGHRVARATHTKMLDMGRAWSVLFGVCFPVTAVVAHAARRRSCALTAAEAPTFDQLVTPDACELRVDGPAKATFICKQAHLQEVGSVFGGCQAMFHEEAAAAAAAARLRTQAPLVLSAMRVQYLKGCGPGDVLDAEVESRRAWRGAGVEAASRLVRAARPALCSEARMSFCVGPPE